MVHRRSLLLVLIAFASGAVGASADRRASQNDGRRFSAAFAHVPFSGSIPSSIAKGTSSFATTDAGSLPRGVAVSPRYLPPRWDVSSPFRRLRSRNYAKVEGSEGREDEGVTSAGYSLAIIGGTGRIGTAVASHLLLRAPPGSKVVLVGRDEQRGLAAVDEVREERGADSGAVSFRRADWRNVADLRSIASTADCVVHCAGPFLGEDPSPLREAVASHRCRAYVDVSDPLDFLEESLAMDDDARLGDTSALVAAGAFPGMSNVMAVEAASVLQGKGNEAQVPIKDVRFNYFTAGLGGSGDVNLYITNLGFGEGMVQYDQGKVRTFEALSGLLLGKVSFFLEDNEIPERKGKGDDDANYENFGNDAAKERIGSRTVFAWPFPEAATTPRELGATGDSSAAMGTAPELWNFMLGALVSIVPRNLWRSERFSKFLADFSQPLVKATDAWLKAASPSSGLDAGETHAMRVDVTAADGSGASIVQGHESFRRCVGQSCAEFALDLLEHPSPGVRLPEQRYRLGVDGDLARRRIVRKLTGTPGTFCFEGPTRSGAPSPPTEMGEALARATQDEAAR